jgi:hypothetical protein
LHDVRFEVSNFLHGLASITSFTADLPAGMRCQQSAYTATNDFMVISHKNTERHKNTSLDNLTATGFVQNLGYTRKKSLRPIQTVHMSIHQHPIGLAIDVDAKNGSPLVSFLHGT